MQYEQEVVCIVKRLSPSAPPAELITWSRSDEGKIALQSLDRDLRLVLRNFFNYIYKKLNEYRQVAH